MSETRTTLVLHLSGAPEPLHVALERQAAEALEPLLAELLAVGESKALTTANGGQFVVNFGHVATAHLEAQRSDSHAYGAPARSTGFGT